MKKCPHCAEEIRDDAKICRYCFKSVKIPWLRRIIISVLILSLSFLIYRHQSDIRRSYRNVQHLFAEAKSAVVTFVDAIKDFKKGSEALKDYKDRRAQIDEINKAMDDKQAGETSN